jgi:large subunit ribosomal protein L24
MSMNRIRKGDRVEVICGDDVGAGQNRTTGRVLRIMPGRRKILVEGVNQVLKHVRPTQRNPGGGRVEKEAPIDISNVALWCDPCGRGVRVGRRDTSEGAGERYCKRCGAGLGDITTADRK